MGDLLLISLGILNCGEFNILCVNMGIVARDNPGRLQLDVIFSVLYRFEQQLDTREWAASSSNLLSDRSRGEI